MFKLPLTSWKNKTRGFLRNQGHWVALGVSLALLFAALAWVSLTNEPAPPLVEYDANPQQAAQEPDFVDRLSQVQPPVPTPEASPPAAPALAWPGAGLLGQTDSGEQPVYQPSLQQWQTHQGVDLLMREGDVVCAAAAGRVTAVGSDELMGGCVTITHADGLVTHYESLLTPVLVQVGDQVETGAPIGGAGIAPAESSQGAHVHFEVVSAAGARVNPLSMLPEIAAK